MASNLVCYTSSGCNRVPHCADWGRNGVICYGSCNGVVVYRPDVLDYKASSGEVQIKFLRENQSSFSFPATDDIPWVPADRLTKLSHYRPGIVDKPAEAVHMLTAHSDRVNCVRWIPSCHYSDDAERELISCSVDKTAILWQGDDGQYKKTAVLKGHAASVTVASALYDQKEQMTAELMPALNIVTASSDSTVRFWKRNSGSSEVTEVQTLTFGNGFVLDLCLILIPETQVPLLACGVDDHKVHLFVLQEGQFVRVMTLPGHEDWVRGVHLTMDDAGDMLLASCGQDSMIRLWRLSQRSEDSGTATFTIRDLPADQDIQMKERTFSYQSQGREQQYYAVTLESVLSGHDSWIYSVRWQLPLKNANGGWHQPLRLLSASMDKTMIVWSPDTENGVWVEQVRVGEVGGNTLGLYGGLFSPLGNSILAHGYQGALHQWIQNKQTCTWEPAVTGGGHFASVEDLDWDRGGGNFILSTSVDQTTRLHAPWVKDGNYVAWYEIARPQVHGYDMQCLTMISRYMFASAGDEKVTRVFQAPRNFIQNLSNICGLDLKTELEREEVSSLPEGASVPALGLSNKAVYDGSQSSVQDDRLIQTPSNQQYAETCFSPLHLTAPPNEEHLLQNTLWPEIRKLYGHGYEVFALASNPSGTLLASSCKASKAEHANILVWDTNSWQKVASLDGSSLTVVQMAFSPSGRYLLAVSRDRTWSLYACQDGTFSRVSFVDKKTTGHSRIIWACAWSHDEQFFFTASRDKKVLVWCVNDVCGTHPPEPVSSMEMKDSITAIDVAPMAIADGRYLLATGLDGGDLVLHTWSGLQSAGDSNHWTHSVLNKCHCHQQTVKRVKFRPVVGLAGQQQVDGSASQWIQLASCGADYCVRVHSINLSTL